MCDIFPCTVQYYIFVLLNFFNSSVMCIFVLRIYGCCSSSAQLSRPVRRLAPPPAGSSHTVFAGSAVPHAPALPAQSSAPARHVLINTRSPSSAPLVCSSALPRRCCPGRLDLRLCDVRSLRSENARVETRVSCFRLFSFHLKTSGHPNPNPNPKE